MLVGADAVGVHVGGDGVAHVDAMLVVGDGQHS
jgi:hypothetical protein